jgi:hypothetical protein
LANFLKIRSTGGVARIANTATALASGGVAMYGNVSNNNSTGSSPPVAFSSVYADARLSIVQLNDPNLPRDVQITWVPSDETALQLHAVADTAASTDTDNFNSTALLFVGWMDYVGGVVAPSNMLVSITWNYEGLPYPTTSQPLDLQVAVGDESAIGRVLSHVRNVPTSVGNAISPATGTEGWVNAARKWINRIAPAISGAEAIYRTVAGGLWSGTADEYQAIMYFHGDFAVLIDRATPENYTDGATRLLATHGITRNVVDYIVPRLLANGADRRRISDTVVRVLAQIDHRDWEHYREVDPDDRKSVASEASISRAPRGKRD